MSSQKNRRLPYEVQAYINKNQKVVTGLELNKKNLSKDRKKVVFKPFQRKKTKKLDFSSIFDKQDKNKTKTVLGQKRIRKLSLRWNHDVLYNSTWIAKLINKLMTAGKKTHAEKIVLKFLTNLNQACQGKPNIVFHEVIEALRPSLTIVVRRIGRRYYQVPVPITTLRQYTVALNWLLNVVKANPRNRAAEVLCDEFVSTYFLKKSEALRQKEQLYQTVIKNRAFNHYRWV